MNKICTSLEQSKRLIELGIDISTADMVWVCGRLHTDGPKYQVLRVKEEVSEPENYISTWSLSALMDLMPKLYDEDDLNDGGCQPVLCKGFDNNMWHVVYRATWYGTDWYCYPIDAAYDMVCWLLENKKI